MIEKKRRFNLIFLICGFIAVGVSWIPFFALGDNAIIPYLDQLDGEILAYILQGKYLFSGENSIPEFLNGVAKTALIPPAPFAVLFFRWFKPLTAYFVLMTLSQTIGYVGMYSVIHKITDKPWVAMLVAILFSYLPFLPVYALSQWGIPLLIVCLYNLYEGNYIKLSLALVILYGLLSSLVLVGFACLGIGILVLLVLTIKKKIKKHLGFLIGIITLSIVYLVENYLLIMQIMGLGAGYVSHKTEYVLATSNFWQLWKDNFLYNGQHSEDMHRYILGIALVAFIIGVFKWGKKHYLLLIGIACNVFLSFCAALWNSVVFLGIRQRLGVIGAFQVERVLWVTPAIWYIILGVSLAIIFEEWKKKRVIAYMVSFFLLGIMTIGILKNSAVKPNLQALIRDDYKAISWSDYYALEIYPLVEAFMEDYTGTEKEEYKVASLGIDPAAALFHGFYCVDGYSNNYPLEYKHAFRQVIEPELEQNEYLKSYFDGWGNRCYLFSKEIPGYFNIEKNTFYYLDLQINTTALKNLGCSYIFSAAYVNNATEIGLKLLTENPVNTADSYYFIYIYEIVD